MVCGWFLLWLCWLRFLSSAGCSPTQQENAYQCQHIWQVFNNRVNDYDIINYVQFEDCGAAYILLVLEDEIVVSRGTKSQIKLVQAR